MNDCITKIKTYFLENNDVDFYSNVCVKRVAILRDFISCDVKYRLSSHYKVK